MSEVRTRKSRRHTRSMCAAEALAPTGVMREPAPVTECGKSERGHGPCTNPPGDGRCNRLDLVSLTRFHSAAARQIGLCSNKYLPPPGKNCSVPSNCKQSAYTPMQYSATLVREALTRADCNSLSAWRGFNQTFYKRSCIPVVRGAVKTRPDHSDCKYRSE
jgi:hypothetical protein